MNPETIVGAVVLGLIEGVTEFVPVSSTAHLLLAGHFMGFQNPGKTFEVLIQLGAILAIVTVYAERLIWLAVSLPSPDPKGRRFVAAVAIAFLPAAVLGALAHDFIKTVLFESPGLIAVVLIVGGVVLLVIDRLSLTVRFTNVMDFPLRTALGIGIFQCLALVPGVSRSGATIAGALLLGADKRSAAEFSFFLAMPTMAGAFAYDFYKNRAIIDADQITLVAIGFIAAFVAAVLVVRKLLDFVSRRGFAPFAWWRIGIGLLVLVLIAFGVGGG
jgi:undecaprenyl-diphosphatase